MSEIMNFENQNKCACGKVHTSSVEHVIVGKGAIERLGELLAQYCVSRAFLLADVNTYAVAGDRICDIFTRNNIGYSKFVFEESRVEPDERAVGAAVMHYDRTCDIIVALGSGVINDIGKILSATVQRPYIIVGTAPSMDGYASATSSMAMDGVKVTLASKCPNAIIGDTDILKTAPTHMLKSGLGDMLAKYVSICEWRISNIITGEYYCETVASYVRAALKKCVDNAGGLLAKDEASIEAVFEGLVACGAAMEYAGLSRPASGVEHYFSHVWDMRGLDRGEEVELHGIQCAVGTAYAIKLYDKIKTMKPDRQKALAYAQSFDLDAWNAELRAFIGKGAEAMIRAEAKAKKYDVERHKARLDIIIDRWADILAVIDEELPSVEEFERILDTIRAPKTAREIGIDESVVPSTFKSAKDIRDKYVLPRLCWDLGVLDDMAETL